MKTPAFLQKVTKDKKMLAAIGIGGVAGLVVLTRKKAGSTAATSADVTPSMSGNSVSGSPFTGAGATGGGGYYDSSAITDGFATLADRINTFGQQLTDSNGVLIDQIGTLNGRVSNLGVYEPQTPTVSDPKPITSVGTPSSSVPTVAYSVQPGENWTSIASKYGISEAGMRAANPGGLNALGTGQTIQLPAAQVQSSAGSAIAALQQRTTASGITSNPGSSSAPSTAVSAPATQTITIQPGQSWNTVSAATGLSTDQLRAQFGSLTALAPGQKLTVKK